MSTAAIAALIVVLIPVLPARAACANPVACENALPGNPASEWDIGQNAGDPSIQGFATDMSTNVGQTVHFKVNTPSVNYRLDIFRLGYYGGLGARKIATLTPTAALPQNQPNCLTDDTTGLIDCGNWAESASWHVPSIAISGVYLALLKRLDAYSGSGVSHVLFVVRNDTSTADILYQTSDTTWGAAYNDYGGNSLYTGHPANRAYKVSYNRPLRVRGSQFERTNFFANEHPMIRWLEANGYSMSYTSGVDSDRQPSATIKQHKIFVSSGHDEYWSKNQRANVESARDAGVNLAFFSGNQVFWKTRWESSIDGSHTPHRTLVTYKESKTGTKIDPSPEWTGTWRDARLSPPYDGGKPENSLTGNFDTVNCCTGFSIKVPAADGKMRLWRGTHVANQAAGATATLTPGVIGFEWDEDIDNGARPAGLIDLSTSPQTNVAKIDAYGNDSTRGNATHRLTLYRAPSGALVFGAATVRWSWGLEDTHDDGASTSDPAMKQATVNLLADMGAQPTTLQAGLLAATKSTDTTKPISKITSPANGANVASGSTVTVTGTATDRGGKVGGIEVSVDGGATWHPATGRDSWSYTTSFGGSGQRTIKSRATDDSGNIEVPTAGVTINVNCPCSIWDNSVEPTNTTFSDTSAAELGVKFRSARAGTITGVRFYKGAGNTGTHIGNLWDTAGQRLATATFSGETASGWQQVTFPSPVTVTANTIYIASYYAPDGHYAYDLHYFNGHTAESPPLYALADGTSEGNGVFKYGLTSSFPNDTYKASNYWVDVVFQ